MAKTPAKKTKTSDKAAKAKAKDVKTKAKAKAKLEKATKETTKAKAKAKAKPAKGDKELSPLEKARLARAKGGKSKTKATKKKRVNFKASADMKGQLFRVDLAFGKDGVLSNSRVIAIKGKPDADNVKTLPLEKYDAFTAQNMVTRIAGPIFIRSEKKRLPAGLIASVMVRAGKNKDGFIRSSVREVKAKLPEKKAKVLDKKDPIYRAIRKAGRFLEGAFTKMQPFPSAKEYKAILKADETQSDDE